MAQNTLYNKVWNAHVVDRLPTGQDQLFIGLHLIHEVTSPQAFDMISEKNMSILFPQRTFATVDHIVPTTQQTRPFQDDQAEAMMGAIEKNVKKYGIQFLNFESGLQGIVHVIGPELGLTQPGLTIACGDSHTSTHGAFGTLAFGIGTTQVRDVLATQCLAMDPLKVRKIEINGKLSKGVFAKDVTLFVIQKLTVKGGLGYAYEYAGEVFSSMNMEERMTVCNMAIEGGARVGYVNPDTTTFQYLKNRKFAPPSNEFDQAIKYWKTVASDLTAQYDDQVQWHASEISPVVTWGITPGQSVGVSDRLPDPSEMSPEDKKLAELAYRHMKLSPRHPILGTPIDVAFVGSCTNSRISDLREAAQIVRGRKVSKKVKAFVVPGSQQIKKQAEQEGLNHIFMEAGFEWRHAGCSMCLAMNPDKLQGDQIAASSSNRNFIGRQGSQEGRTLLMSPAMVALAAIEGQIRDVREVYQ
jgi:3-isopropylmalate/(R)-2-methylmalate dehydratase large subunit